VRPAPDPLDRLTRLSRELGEPSRELVVLAEGNTSIALPDGTLWIKASGAYLRTATARDFVRVRPEPLIDLLDGPELPDAELRDRMAGACVEGVGRPSIEAILHALAVHEFGAAAAAHTHPVAGNAILCSDRSRQLVAGVLFPDQAVVCGVDASYVDYAPPGIALARKVRTAIAETAQRVGEPPRTVWLANHGLLALGRSPADALAITEMADKFARVLGGVLALGDPRWLSERQVRDLVARDDEVARRALLAERA
jgi:rhamnose utilization protein RhaD (predicted bifunctional aldolase and dehydrogenase)